MNAPQSLLDSSTPKAESGFLFDDWDMLEEKSPTETVALFDGKIIARMPDLGSESIVKNIEKPKFPTFWGQVCDSTLAAFQGKVSASTETHQRLFHRVTAVGGIVLLCGILVLFVGTEKDKTTENTIDTSEILTRNTETAPVVSKTFVTESAFSPIMQSGAGNVMSDTVSQAAIPVASVESVAAVSPPSPWDRPATDSHISHSQGTVSPRQPANPFQPLDVAVASPAPATLSETVVMTPMAPIAANSMPISPHEMPVSPFEMQLVAQSNVPPHPPVSTYVQPSQPPVPPGMASVHGRQENMPMGASQQSTYLHPSAPQQYVPAAHRHSYVPEQTMQGNNPHSQFGQHTPQYVVPPGYMLPPSQQPPQTVPIPSGVSTLTPQGGYHAQPQHGMHGMPGQYMQPLGVPMQSPPSDFFNAPPNSRWM